MKVDFLTLASQIKLSLGQKYKGVDFSKDYIYSTICHLIREVECGRFSSPTTDIGVAAVKMFDSNTAEDNRLVADISNLGQMYRRMQRVSLQNS